MTASRSHRRLLAAPTLGERGGGVGQVSSLLWQSMQDTWNGRSALMTLLQNGHQTPTRFDKLRFGVELASAQMLDRPMWVLFAHLGLARAERFLPAASRAPYGVFLHGIECWEPLPARDLDLLAGASVRIANSAFTARKAREANPSLGPIEVCPLALGALPRLAVSPSRIPGRVLVVGRLSATERYKGHEQLIDAWPAVRARVPDATLVIVGDGGDRPRLEHLARGLGSAIEFRGFVSREALDEEYAKASLFAMPSRGEGFGLVYLEAMAHGLACLGSTADAAAEVIVDGQTGVLADPGDPQALAQELIDLLGQPDVLRTMGDAGRARLHETFTYEAFRQRLVSLVSEALEPAGALA
jgi:phosphatidylinositol alpha-1,6-mannosyltransferase